MEGIPAFARVRTRASFRNPGSVPGPDGPPCANQKDAAYLLLHTILFDCGMICLFSQNGVTCPVRKKTYHQRLARGQIAIRHAGRGAGVRWRLSNACGTPGCSCTGGNVCAQHGVFPTANAKGITRRSCRAGHGERKHICQFNQ